MQGRRCRDGQLRKGGTEIGVAGTIDGQESLVPLSARLKQGKAFLLSYIIGINA